MSAHSIAAEMRAVIHGYRRRTRVGGPEECLIAKDQVCALLDRQLDSLLRAIGTVEPRSFAGSGQSAKGVPFVVARRRRAVPKAA